MGLAVIAAVAVAIILSREKDPYVGQAPPELPKPTLSELAERNGIEIGNFASLKYLRERPYAEITSQQFDLAVVDGEPNWHFEDFTLRPGPEEFDFKNMDQVFDFADQHDMPARVQHLVWGEEKWLPDWLKNGKYTEAELMEFLHNHIDTVVKRYEGKATQYSVVNEAFSRELEKGGNKDWWGEKLGRDYIDASFKWAREADPNAILILNDFDNERINDSSDLMYEYIEGAQKRDVPIDAVGLQMHIDGQSAASKEEVVKNMERFKKLGVEVYVTEFDVNMSNVDLEGEELYQKQATIYADMMNACLDVGADVCPSFSYLGLVDRQSWYKGIGVEDGQPLMFLDDYTPKPAFFATRDALQKKSDSMAEL